MPIEKFSLKQNNVENIGKMKLCEKINVKKNK